MRTGRILLICGLLVGGPAAEAAAGPLAQAAERLAQQAARHMPAAPPAVGAAARQGGLSTSSMGRKKKWLIALGAAVAFTGAAWAIDRAVEDVTPSTLGTRKD